MQGARPTPYLSQNPHPARIMPREDAPIEEQAEAFFAKFTEPARPSEHLKYLELPAWDARHSFVTDAAFDLGDRAIDACDALGLSSAMRTLRPAQLTELHLHRCSLCADGLAAVVAALPALPALESLFAMQNGAGDGAMSAFAGLARTGGVPLRRLALQENGITDCGAASLAAALAGATPQLEWLYLSGNEIGDEGGVAIAEAVEGGACPRLARLALQHNRLGDATLLALGRAAAGGKLPKGEYLYVHENEHTPAGRDALAAALEGHPNQLQAHLGWPPPLPRDELRRDEAAATVPPLPLPLPLPCPPHAARAFPAPTPRPGLLAARRHRSPARRPSASPTRRRPLGWRRLTRMETCRPGGCGQRQPPPRRSRSWSRRPAHRPPPRTLSRRTSRPPRGSCPVTFSSGCWRCETEAKRLQDNALGSRILDASRSLRAGCHVHVCCVLREKVHGAERDGPGHKLYAMVG